MKKHFLAIAAVIAVSFAPSFAYAAPAVDPAVAEATRQMFDAMKLRDAMVASMRQAAQTMPVQMHAAITGQIKSDAAMSAEQKTAALARLEKTLPAMTAQTQALFNDPTLVDDMLTEMVPLYTETYSVDEIRQLTVFYTSPLGRKMMDNMPKLMGQAMAISNRVMMPRIEKFMARTAQDLVGKQ